MTPQLTHIANWMPRQHRTVRFAPVTKIPGEERVDAISFIRDALHDLANATKVRVSGTFTTTTPTSTIDPIEVFHCLTAVHAQVLAAYHTYGMGAAESVGIFELTKDSPTKDFKKALETYYPQQKP